MVAALVSTESQMCGTWAKEYVSGPERGESFPALVVISWRVPRLWRSGERLKDGGRCLPPYYEVRETETQPNDNCPRRRNYTPLHSAPYSFEKKVWVVEQKRGEAPDSADIVVLLV